MSIISVKLEEEKEEEKKRTNQPGEDPWSEQISADQRIVLGILQVKIFPDQEQRVKSQVGIFGPLLL